MVKWSREYHNLGDTSLDPKKIFQYLVFRTVFAPYTLLHKCTKSLTCSVRGYCPENTLEATLLQEKPDIPFAVLSSGGVDSSVLSKLYDGPNVLHLFVQTLANANEEQYFNSLARTLQGQIDKFVFTAESYHECQKELFGRLPEPLGDPAIIAVYGAARYIKQKYPHIKCIVVGEAGDEVFGGYWLYPEFTNFQGEFVKLMEKVYTHWGLCFLSRFRSSPDIRQTLDMLGGRIWEHRETIGNIGGIMDIDRHLFLPNGVIYKNTIACELNGIQCSIPYSHPQVENIADAFPLQKRVNVGAKDAHMQTKPLLKELALKLGVPSDCVLRIKTGFSSIPSESVLRWMNDELAYGGIGLRGSGWLETSVMWSLWYWCKQNGLEDQLKSILHILG